MIDPGLMREKIIIEKNASSLDGRGNPDGKWEEYYSCRAYANGLYGSEYYAARQAGLEQTVKLTVRYTPKLTGLVLSNYRLTFRGQIYDIDYIDNVRYEDNMMIIHAVSREGEIDGR
jgi:SPP1 family predicted phage head-tail adaptor